MSCPRPSAGRSSAASCDVSLWGLRPRETASPVAGRVGTILGLPGPAPGFMGAMRPHTPQFTFVRTKVNRKSASPLRAGPPLLSNRTPAKEHCAATETLFRLRLVVIGLVGHRLRLPALVLIGLSCQAQQIDGSVLFKRATAEVGQAARHRSDPRRICWFSGTARSKSHRNRLDKGFQNLGFGALLVTFPAREK